MGQRSRKVQKLIVRLGVTVGLLSFVFAKLELQQLGAALQVVELHFLLGVGLLTIVNFWIRSTRLRLILVRQGCEVSTRTIFGASAIASLWRLILPGFISTGVKWYVLKTHTNRAPGVLSSMVYNQASEVIVKVWLGLAALALVNPYGNRQLSFLSAAGAVAVLVGCALLLTHYVRKRAAAMLARLLPSLPERLGARVIELSRQLGAFQNAGWAFHLQMAGITVLSSVVTMVIYWCAASAAQITVPPIALLWQSCVVFLLGMLPVTIANLGLREVTLIEFLGSYGAGPPAAFMMSMAVFSAVILMAAIGAVYQILWGTKQ